MASNYASRVDEAIADPVCQGTILGGSIAKAVRKRIVLLHQAHRGGMSERPVIVRRLPTTGVIKGKVMNFKHFLEQAAGESVGRTEAPRA